MAAAASGREMPTGASAPSVCVIFEDRERTVHLLEALAEHAAARGVVVVEWCVADGGVLDTARPPPPDTVFFCRVSGSGWTRAPGVTEYLSAVVDWLEAWGAPVINGAEAARLETSRVRQGLALDGAGIRRPRAVLAFGKAALTAAPATLLPPDRLETPMFVKPLSGGGGAHVVAVRGADDLVVRVHGRDKQPPTPVSDVCVCERGLTRADRGRSISVRSATFRLEIVDFSPLYVCATLGDLDDTQRCPCDMRRTLRTMHFEIVEPTAVMPPPVWSMFADRVTRLCEDRDVAVCGVEFMMSRGEPVVIDWNMNTNYSRDAEARADAPSGYGAVATMLVDRAFAEGAVGAEAMPAKAMPPEAMPSEAMPAKAMPAKATTSATAGGAANPTDDSVVQPTSRGE